MLSPLNNTSTDSTAWQRYSLCCQTQKTFLDRLKWKILPHALYTPDIARSNYCLFHSIAHCLTDQLFCSHEEITKWLDSWIAKNDEHFYGDGIRTLPEKWEKKVVVIDGLYFERFICNHLFTIMLHFKFKKNNKIKRSYLPPNNIKCYWRYFSRAI